jgi:hypothetical protein
VAHMGKFSLIYMWPPLNSAATAAWRVNTPARFISEIFDTADY